MQSVVKNQQRKFWQRCLLSVGIAAAMAFPAHAAQVDLVNATVADLQAAMSKGSLTSEKLIQLELARIKAYDDVGPKLNALILVNPNALD